MIPIKFDLSSVVKTFELTRKESQNLAQACVKEVTIAIYSNWQAAAMKNLKTSKRDYIRGLIISDRGKTSSSIILTGILNNMIESGVDPFDMKSGFSKSSKIKIGKNGKWYLTIPLKFGIPGSSNDSFSQIMPQNVYLVAKNQGVTTIKNLPGGALVKSVREAISVMKTNNKFDEYKHKSSIYVGINKNSSTYSSGVTQNTYNSFRRVSAMSNQNSWIHKGIMPRNLAEMAVQNTDIQAIVNAKTNEILSEIGF